MPQTPTTTSRRAAPPSSGAPAHSLAESALGVSDACETEPQIIHIKNRRSGFLLDRQGCAEVGATSALHPRRRTPPSSQNVSHSGVRLQQLAAQPAPRRAGSPSACQENGYHHRRRCLQGRCCWPDTRATEGDTVADKNCEKIHYIADNIWCCGAGVRRQDSRSPTEGGASWHS